MTKILVVEDERDLRQVLEYNLRHAGFQVVLAATGTEGIALAREHGPGLVLLDLMLPDISGTEVCRVLKEDPRTRATPIVMVTRPGRGDRPVVGFELGAEDYIVKPFSVRELLLRVQAILRRQRGEARPSAEPIEFGVLRIDREAHRVWVEGKEIELTALEFKLLVTLYDRRNRVQSRAALLDDVWGIQGGHHHPHRRHSRHAPSREARQCPRLRGDCAWRRLPVRRAPGEAAP
jgi:two-component system phosphate regulon response regulator PhoB